MFVFSWHHAGCTGCQTLLAFFPSKVLIREEEDMDVVAGLQKTGAVALIACFVLRSGGRSHICSIQGVVFFSMGPIVKLDHQPRKYLSLELQVPPYADQRGSTFFSFTAFQLEPIQHHVLMCINCKIIIVVTKVDCTGPSFHHIKCRKRKCTSKGILPPCFTTLCLVYSSLRAERKPQ